MAPSQRDPQLNLTGYGYRLKRQTDPVGLNKKVRGALRAFRVERRNAGT